MFKSVNGTNYTLTDKIDDDNNNFMIDKIRDESGKFVDFSKWVKKSHSIGHHFDADAIIIDWEKEVERQEVVEVFSLYDERSNSWNVSMVDMEDGEVGLFEREFNLAQ